MFVKNVIKLASGSSIAKILPFLALPILTRSMSPEEFGLYSIYFSITMMFGALVSLRLDYAINAARNENEAKLIFLLCMLFTLIGSLIISFVVFVLYISEHVGLIWLSLPLSICLMSINLCLTCLCNYFGFFKVMSYGRIINACVCFIVQLIFVLLLKVNDGAYFGIILGYLISSFYLLYKVSIYSFVKIVNVRKKMRIVFFRYISYPKLIFPGSFINFATGNAPIYFIGSFFGTSQVGYYSLAFRISSGVVAILARSISEVYRAKACFYFNQNGNFIEVFRTVSKLSFVISISGFLLLSLIAEPLFEFLFGDGWGISVEYTKILIPAFILQFVTTCVGYSLMIVKWQKYDFLWQIFRLILTIISLSIVYLLSLSEKDFIFITSCSLTIGYLVYYFICHKSSYGKGKLW